MVLFSIDINKKTVPGVAYIYVLVAIVKRHPTNFMARQIIFIALLIMTHSVYGQKTKNNLAKIPPGIPTKKEMETEERNHNCIKRVNRTFTARLKNYPFNISTQIQFVSFIDSTSIEDSLPRLNDTICYSKLKEVIYLSKAVLKTNFS